LREKLIDLQIAGAAATRSGMVTNSNEIMEGTEESIMELLDKPLTEDL
jgi:hypothetical protein